MRSFLLVLLGILNAAASSSSPFAQSVIEYSSGSGATPGYDNPLAALGEPSRANPGSFGGPVDPFNPPFLPEQLVSIGAGGFLTVQFDSPLLNDAANPFGIDLLIFGNNGFSITNGNFEGGGITDGNTFTFDPPGASRVLVSADGIMFFELVPPTDVSVTVDGLFPTDSRGDFQTPVDPSLSREDFAGLDLTGIRNRYDNSAGGAGFDLAWARHADGSPAYLADARFVRLEGLNGKIEVDALVVVPEPQPAYLFLFTIGLWSVVHWQRRAQRKA